MTADIAIATHAGAAGGLADDRLLASALQQRGLGARFCVWNDPDVDWSLSPLTIIRSTWDYFNHHAAWFAWIDGTAPLTRLANGWNTVRWNSDKLYLADLAAAGVRCAPTRFVATAEGASIALILAETGWEDIIIKPAIAGGAKGARRFRAGDIAAAGAHLAALAAEGRALVQPFLASVETAQERSLVFIEGAFSHAWRKPAFNNAPRDFPRHDPDAEELALAHAALGAARAINREGEGLVYARVDVAPAPGGPMLMELELIEPDLGLRLNPPAAAALAGALAQSLK